MRNFVRKTLHQISTFTTVVANLTDRGLRNSIACITVTNIQVWKHHVGITYYLGTMLSLHNDTLVSYHNNVHMTICYHDNTVNM